jgi:hypothetical protein
MRRIQLAILSLAVLAACVRAGHLPTTQATDGGLKDGGLKDGGLKDGGLKDGGLRRDKYCVYLEDGGLPWEWPMKNDGCRVECHFGFPVPVSVDGGVHRCSTGLETRMDPPPWVDFPTTDSPRR